MKHVTRCEMQANMETNCKKTENTSKHLNTLQIYKTQVSTETSYRNRKFNQMLIQKKAFIEKQPNIETH